MLCFGKIIVELKAVSVLCDEHRAQVHNYLQATGLTSETYLTLLTDRATSILAQGLPATYPVSLAASLQLASQRLADDDPPALTLLQLSAQLAPEPIPLTLFTAHPDLQLAVARDGRVQIHGDAAAGLESAIHDEAERTAIVVRTEQHDGAVEVRVDQRRRCHEELSAKRVHRFIVPRRA